MIRVAYLRREAFELNRVNRTVAWCPEVELIRVLLLIET
jgi:hypothetical protein